MQNSSLIIATSLAFAGLIISLGPVSATQQNIKTFEERLSEQLNNKSNMSSQSNSTDLTTDSSILQLPRNSSISKIQADNQSIEALYNDSIKNMNESTEKTRQNISNILSVLK